MSDRDEKGGGSGCLRATGIGCLSVLGVLVLLAIIVAWNFKAIAVSFARRGITTFITQSDLAQDQKARILTQVDRVAEGYRRGRISNAQMGRVFERLGELPLVHLGAAHLARERYVEASSLTEQEKAEAALLLERFARGVFEQTLKEKDVEEVLALVSEPSSRKGQERELKESLTREELDEFLALVRQKVEAAGVPQERYEIDVAAEIERVVTEVLGAP